LRMLREEDSESCKEIEVLCSGQKFRYSKKEIVAEREEHHNVFEKRDPCVVTQITPYKKRKEREREGSSVQSNKRRKSISY